MKPQRGRASSRVAQERRFSRGGRRCHPRVSRPHSQPARAAPGSPATSPGLPSPPPLFPGRRAGGERRRHLLGARARGRGPGRGGGGGREAPEVAAARGGLRGALGCPNPPSAVCAPPAHPALPSRPSRWAQRAAGLSAVPGLLLPGAPPSPGRGGTESCAQELNTC